MKKPGTGTCSRANSCYVFGMSQVAELLKEALKLDLPDRAELVSFLLEDLDPSPHHVSDEEVLRRLEDLRSARIKGLSEEEFWKACGRA
jgi:putative addiction module component (TIGR02574 family)